ncbi:alpha-2-macroglobulin family protein [Pseudooceanicola nitratireducens]|uniref:alpha-2-macroglobulin family protein n=1 Tax=Pseudooceanicola nitratireducens TaxID=517719 RepID=UPI001C95ED8F|nr:alpha-2-macroglobulin family protein [Pseudooceanicola nitratireducens]MBY6167068.1 alpha-2-macroglobulin family protein [Pseudooceanicola nitratireducens]
MFRRHAAPTLSILGLVLGLSLGVTGAQAQQDPLPERRMVVTLDQDFVGTDLSQMFDTTFTACRAACESDSACLGFTFNARSNSCFPKSAITGQTPYQGAQSALLMPFTDALRSQAAQRVQDVAYLGENTMEDARILARDLGWIHPSGQYRAGDMLSAARQREADGKLLEAMRWMGGAVSATDAADQWVDYARLLLASAETTDRNAARYRARAVSAAVNGYLRADSAPIRANALDQLARALEAVNRGRDVIPALRLADQLAPREDRAAALDRAVGLYGFRIRDHEVLSDLADPQVCAEFTEPLVKAGVDYGDYVQLPDPTLAVEADGNRLCVRGLTHGDRATLTFREGLPAASGERLIKDVPLRVYVRDRSPQVNFAGRAYVLPAAQEAALPVETVNADLLDLTLYRVTDRNLLRAVQEQYFGQRLNPWEMADFTAEIAEEIWRGEAETAMTLNRTMTTRLPLGEVLAGQEPGAYALAAKLPGEDQEAAFQWFILTDLGLTTMQGNDGLHVVLRGLGDAEPKPGVTVELIGRANRVLGQGMTDDQGYVRFDPGLTRGTDGAAPAMVTARLGDDLAFLSLTDPAFDLSDRGVAGQEPAPPVDVFLTTDRGAYRAGEVIHVTALARDARTRAIPGLPITAILTRPDGVEYARLTSSRDQAGGHVFDLPLGQTVPRGTWRVDIKADVSAPALASARVLVEDFLPERIDVTLNLPEGPLNAQALPDLALQANYLFGAPGAGLAVEGTLRLSQARQLDSHPGYHFGLYDGDGFARTTRLDGTTGDTGALALPLTPDFPEVPTGTPYQLRATIGVSEGSGRPVERQITRLVGPDAPVIGIKPLFTDSVPEGATAAFDLIALSPDLTPQDMPVTWRVNRVTTRYQWYRQYGSWNWEPYTTRTPVAEGTARLGDTPVEVSVPTDWGRYEIVVEGGDGAAGYVASSVDFTSGWYAPADASSTPDMLEVSLDKPGYALNDWAQLRLVPRHAGTAIVTVMSDRLIEMKTVEVTEGENIVNLKVTEDWGAGAYVTASVIRPMKAEAGQMPTRALGLDYAPVDPGAKALEVTLDLPDQANPRGPVTARVKVAGQGKSQAYVTLAAVDVGILNLTGFDSPDPKAHYFGQRRLGMDIRDLYGRLIDRGQGAMGRVRSGGDAGGSIGLQSPPPTEDLVAAFTGPVAIGPDGTAEVSFDLPEFNGTVRFMAVAWTDQAVGAAERDVLVRDPVVLTATLPRFLQPGDTTTLLLELTHAFGPTGDTGLSVSAQGVTLPDPVPASVTLEDGARQVLRIPVTADLPGDHAITITLTTPGGQALSKTLTLPVRRTDPEVSVTQRFNLAAGDTFTLDANVFAGMRPGSGQAMVSAGPLAQFDAPALLAMLDRYPYGCTEQVTSTALPLLYLSSVAEAMDLAAPAELDLRISQSIDRVLTRQDSSGAFGLWQAGSEELWLDAYVTDFLSRAKAQGHDVPDLAFGQALDNLRNRVNYAPDFDADSNTGGEALAYALMVLAREGKANMGDLRYYADVKGAAFGTPLAAAQLGAALAMYGDPTRADAMFAIAARQLDARAAQDEPQRYRDDFGTHLRDAAAVLTLAVESGSQAVNRASLIARITGADGPLSTQESAWSLMAARALIDTPATGGTATPALSVNGAPVTGPFVRMVEAQALTSLAIRNTSGADTALTLTTLGVPESPVPQGGYGYAIQRDYYTLDGVPADPAQVPQGTRLVTVLTVLPFEDTGARLMVSDPLPAGFEIDNPNLLRQGDIRALDWLKTVDVAHSEARSDRFLTALDWRSDQAFRLAYIVRAISPGSYHHPAATVEDMYRPRYRARTAAGRVTVVE